MLDNESLKSAIAREINGLQAVASAARGIDAEGVPVVKAAKLLLAVVKARTDLGKAVATVRKASTPEDKEVDLQ